MKKEFSLTLFIGRLLLGIIMMVVSILNLLNIMNSDKSILATLLLFGGIATIFWGIQQ